MRSNVQDIGDRPAALHLKLQAVITNRQVLAGFNPQPEPPGPAA